MERIEAVVIDRSQMGDETCGEESRVSQLRSTSKF